MMLDPARVTCRPRSAPAHHARVLDPPATYAPRPGTAVYARVMAQRGRDGDRSLHWRKWALLRNLFDVFEERFHGAQQDDFLHWTSETILTNLNAQHRRSRREPYALTRDEFVNVVRAVNVKCSKSTFLHLWEYLGGVDLADILYVFRLFLAEDESVDATLAALFEIFVAYNGRLKRIDKLFVFCAASESERKRVARLVHARLIPALLARAPPPLDSSCSDGCSPDTWARLRDADGETRRGAFLKAIHTSAPSLYDSFDAMIHHNTILVNTSKPRLEP